MTSFLDPEFEPPVERDGFRGAPRAARAPGRRGAPRRSACSRSSRATPPFPLHFHFGNEEMLIVLSASSALRTADGERQLAEGEVVSLPAGEDGLHQVINRGDGPARLLIASEMNAPDVVVRPESAKLSAVRLPARRRRRASTSATTAATRSTSGRASPAPAAVAAAPAGCGAREGHHKRYESATPARAQKPSHLLRRRIRPSAPSQRFRAAGARTHATNVTPGAPAVAGPPARVPPKREWLISLHSPSFPATRGPRGPRSAQGTPQTLCNPTSARPNAESSLRPLSDPEHHRRFRAAGARVAHHERHARRTGPGWPTSPAPPASARPWTARGARSRYNSPRDRAGRSGGGGDDGRRDRQACLSRWL